MQGNNSCHNFSLTNLKAEPRHFSMNFLSTISSKSTKDYPWKCHCPRWGEKVEMPKSSHHYSEHFLNVAMLLESWRLPKLLHQKTLRLSWLIGCRQSPWYHHVLHKLCFHPKKKVFILVFNTLPYTPAEISLTLKKKKPVAECQQSLASNMMDTIFGY